VLVMVMVMEAGIYLSKVSCEEIARHGSGDKTGTSSGNS
jgi:hypothetical protein